MKMKNRIFFLLPLLVVFLMSSCSRTISPNAQKICGKWVPDKVEKILTPEQKQQLETMQKQQAAKTPEKAPAATTAPTAQSDEKKGAAATTATAATGEPAKTATKAGDKKGGADIKGQKAAKTLDHLVQTEMRTPIVISPDRTAEKFYPGKTIKATWKMKKSGKAIVAKNLETKDKFVLQIEELTETRAVIVENLPVGSLRITYHREK